MFAFKKFLFESMLLEDKVDFITDKQGPKVWDAYEKDKGQGKPKVKDAKEAIQVLSKWSEKNLQWLVNSYVKGLFSLEDKGKMTDVIEKFEKFKKKLEKKDLGQYKTIDEIEKALEGFTDEDAKSKKQLSKEEEQRFFKEGEAKMFYQKGGIKVIIPKTEKASCHFGIGTKWCTAADKNNMFESYSKRGSLYIVFTDDGRKYQFFFRVGQQQFADEKDHMLSHKEMGELLKKYPAIIDAFEKTAKKAGYLPMIKDPTEEDLKKVAKNDARDVIDYAKGKKIKLPDDVALIVFEKNQSNLTTNPEIFDLDFTMALFKNQGSMFHKASLMLGWLRNTKITEKEFGDVIDIVLDKPSHNAYFFKGIFDVHGDDTSGMMKHYADWTKKLPVEKIEKLIDADKDSIDMLGDILPENKKIDLINKDPDALKHFKEPTNKMKQAAQWAADRIKRQRRGF